MLKKYAARERRKIPGWLSRIDAEIIRTLVTFQNDQDLEGSVAEIGVHHGKLFVELCLALKPSQRAYAIDIFEKQQFNEDSSGQGSREALVNNLALFNVPSDQVAIDARPSQEVLPSDILSAVGRVRLFSIDGGHWLEVVQSDMTLAESTLADFGIIALDDFHRPEWPDVSAGYFAWYSCRNRPFVPIAIGTNKLYLAHQDWADRYRAAIERNEFLKTFASKRAVFQGQPVLVLQRYLLSDLPLRNVIQVLLMTFVPTFYVWIKRAAKRQDFSALSE